MEKLRIPFNLYDFLGYLVPGMLVLWVLGTLVTSLLGIPFPIPTGEDWVSALLFILAGYVAGHAIQALGNRAERYLVQDVWGGWPSERLLADEGEWAERIRGLDETWRQQTVVRQRVRSLVLKMFPRDAHRHHYSKSFRERLAETMAARFNFSDVSSTEAFQLSYSSLIVESVPSHVELFNGFYSFYRGMIIACLASAGTFVLVLIRDVIGSCEWTAGLCRWQLAARDGLLAIAFLYGAFLFTHRYGRFAEHFADAVYRSFYSHYWSDNHARSGSPGNP